jgi:dTDP-4-amino-4,6-dideoxygalactose transaminase
LEYITEAVGTGGLSGDQTFSKRCHAWLEDYCQSERAFLTHSCTAALEMAALLSGVGPGDEVIMPSYTFVSTANAFVLRGATPVFVDVEPSTLNIDPGLVADAVTERTKVIVPVHYAGVACDMAAIGDIADERGLMIVEDAAQALGSTWHGRPLGGIGHLGCFSFHETKNVTSGEGGALLVNDQRFVERAEIIREKGTNRSQFFRGFTDKYTWVDIGSSFLPGELIAAFLFAQFERAEAITAERRAIVRRYQREFEPLASAGLLTLPRVPLGDVSNGHMFYLRTRGIAERTALLKKLADDGIGAVFHYVPLHSSPAGLRYGRTGSPMPVTDALADDLVRLPVYNGMAEHDQARVIEAVHGFYLGH